MRTQFTRDGIVRLDRDVKALRRANTLLTQVQARDQIALREGWPTWALLKKNSIRPGPSECLELVVRPFRGGDHGVFHFKLAINDLKMLEAVDRAGGLSFELPALPDRWIIRHFEGAESCLDRRPLRTRGRFFGAKFLCIVSVNGVQLAEVEQEIASALALICARLREAALQALEAIVPTPSAGQVRLFYCRPCNSGVDEMADRVFSSVEAAREAQLPQGCQPVGIRVEDGWWTFQAQLGWQPPAK